jgi:[glutamine synthetase] adenylyltransferase / [glutamine synthetase]-adenylyl-L-tyrosine phosphorylase
VSSGVRSLWPDGTASSAGERYSRQEMSEQTGQDPLPLAAAVSRACPDVPPATVHEFLERIGESYLSRRSPEEMALHVRLASEVGPERPARVHVSPGAEGRYDVAVVAVDYFGEFSILCGLLAVHGLSIESGEVHTFRPSAPPLVPPTRRRRSPPSTKIVDVFRVVPRAGRKAPDAARLERDLLALLALAADGRAVEARERLNRQLVESLAAVEGELARTVHPVAIEFDNAASAAWTVMQVRGQDAPAFLYALANALAMREIYVHEVRIESEGPLVRDEFAITHRDGRKIEGESDQQALRLAVVLIKQFTHFLPSAPDPARALRSFDQLLDRLMSSEAAWPLFREGNALRELARLLGSSEFLWEDLLRRHIEHLAPLLGDWKSRALRDRAALRAELRQRLQDAPSFGERKRRLNEFKDEEMLLVDMKQLLDPAVSLGEFETALSDLAEAALETALDLCHSGFVETHGQPRLSDGRVCPMAFFGLGKFGGRELGYASDLELLVVYEGAGRTDGSGLENGEFFERLVQHLVETLEAREEGIFHIDLRLRPHGKKGALASPLGFLREYYSTRGEAHPFERQALIKMRTVAGDQALGREVEALRDGYVWGGEPWDTGEALRLRERQLKELVPAGRFNVKLSRGGLVDVEYTAQYLQIQHGHDYVELRTPRTLAALLALMQLGILSAPEHDALRDAYLFWRRTADALRMVRGQASDLLLPDEGSEELRLLARRLGYSGSDWAEAAGALDSDIDRNRLAVQAVFDRRFRPQASSTLP